MNEKGEITPNTKEIQTILKTYYEQQYANKLGNLEEMDAFLESQKLPKLEQEEIENLNRGIPGWRSGLAPAFGPGPDPGTWDRVPRQAPCMEPASVSACVSASLCLS